MCVRKTVAPQLHGETDTHRKMHKQTHWTEEQTDVGSTTTAVARQKDTHNID